MTVDIDVGQNLAGIEFGANAGAYTLTHVGSNKTLTLGSYGIRNYSSSDQTITGANLRVTINAPTTFRNDGTGTLTISAAENTLNTSGTNSLTLRGTGNGTLSTAVGGTGNLYKLDSGTWTVSNTANNYADTIIGAAGGASGGTLALGSSGSLGSGALAVYAGTLNTGLGSYSETVATLTLGGGASGTAASITGNATLVLGGDITYDATNNPNGATITANLDQNGVDKTFVVGDSTAASADLTVSGVISGNKKLYKEGAGTLVLSGNNTYSDGTYVNGGTLAVYSLADGGTASSIGQSAFGTAEFTLNSGTLQYLGSGSNTNRLFTVTTAGGTLDASGTGAVDFTNVGALKMGGSGTRTLTLSGTSTANNTLSPTIGNSGGATSVTKAGTGTWILGASNSSYAGVTTVAGGVLSVATLANGGANSSIGASTSVASNLVFTGGTLRYTGGAGSTDRLFTIGSGSGTIDASGTGALTFSNSGNLAATGIGNRTLTLTGSNTGSNTLASALVDSSATDKTALMKAGTGTWTLTGNNTHTGGTTLNAGTLNLNSATALGGSSGIFTINAGTINNTTAGAIVLTGNNGQAWNGDFTFAGTQNLNLGTGAVTLNATPTITTSAGTLTVGGAIGGVGLGVTKAGAGILALTGTNSSYTGATTIYSGTLSITAMANGGSNSSLGAAGNSAANLVLNGGTLQYTGSGHSSDRLFSVGTSGGTLEAAGSGTLTLSNSGSMGFNGQTGARTLALAGTGTGAVAATIADNGGTTSITKADTGTWTLNGTASNTFTGTTTVNAGTLALGKTGGAIAIGGNVTIGDGVGTDAVRLDASNQIASGSVVSFAAGGSPTLNLNGFSQTLGLLSSSNTDAQVQLGSPAVSSALTVGNSSTATFAGVISGAAGAGFIKAGTGSLTLSGNNTYFGQTTITQGTLAAAGSAALGDATGAVVVSPGGTLSMAGGITIAKSATLSLSGTGAIPTTGALHAGGTTGTTSKWEGGIALTGNATVTAADNLLVLGVTSGVSDTLSLDANTLTLHAGTAPAVTPVHEPLPAYVLDPSNVVVYSRITGTGGLTKTGVGTVTVIAGAAGNPFTGNTVVSEGKLILDGSNDKPAVSSTNVVVGNSNALPGTADAVILQIGQLANATGPQNVIGALNAATNASSSSMTIYSDGVLKLNNAKAGLASLTLQGGHVDGGSSGTNAVLTLGGSVTTNASSRVALINNGKLALSANDFTFTVAAGSTATGVDLQIDSVVQSGAGFTAGGSGTGMLKAGAGKMLLTNANTFSGITSIAAGTLAIQHGSALGQTGSFHGDTANGTVVQNGGQLQLQGGITVGALESLTLNGTGSGGDGALRNIAGSNVLNGFVYLATDGRINADAGTTLTIAHTDGLSSTIINGTTAGKNLTVGGAGNTIVNGAIANSVSGVSKDGAGTLTLGGANSYTGATNISSGAVKVMHSNALSGSGVIVGNGAALHFAQDGGGNNLAVGAVGVTINGTGLSGGGAIQNLTGNNSYAGPVTLGSNSLISATGGTRLNLSGGIGTSAHGLIVGTAANNGDITINGNVSGGGSLTKAGSGGLTFSGANTAFGVVTMSSGALTFSGDTVTTGAIHLNGGSISVGTDTSLSSGAVDAVAGTTLTIASGASVAANYASGVTTFSGALAGQGEFEKLGAGTLVFNNTFSAADLTLTLNGGTLSLAGQFTFGTVHITGNTVLDFNNSAGTFLSSANLIIDAGVTVTVNNWISVANNAAMSSVWYATNTVNGGTLGGTTQTGGTPLSQVTFTNYTGLTGSWVAGNPYGWFDHEIRPTPEPATYGAVLVAGCFGWFGIRRLRRTNR